MHVVFLRTFYLRTILSELHRKLRDAPPTLLVGPPLLPAFNPEQFRVLRVVLHVSAHFRHETWFSGTYIRRPFKYSQLLTDSLYFVVRASAALVPRRTCRSAARNF